MRIYCDTCEMAGHSNKDHMEKTVKFKVGDVVSVQGTVGQVWANGNMVDVKFDKEQNAACIPTRMLTLVERPKKFEIGKRYKFGSRGSHTYMRLGDNQWFDYDRDTTIQDKDLDMFYLDELDS